MRRFPTLRLTWHALLGLLALSSPSGSEERVFFNEDHSQLGHGYTRVQCAASGNVWTHGSALMSRFDGLGWTTSDPTFDLPTVDDRGGLWKVFDQSFLGPFLLNVDSRAGGPPRGLTLGTNSFGGHSSRVEYSDSDTAFIVSVGYGIAAFPWRTDRRDPAPFPAPGVLLDSPLPDPYSNPFTVLRRLNDGEIWFAGIDGSYRRRNRTWERSNSPLAPPLFHSRNGLYWSVRQDSIFGWTDQGIAVVDPPSPGRNIGEVNALFEDASGHLWAAGHGLAVRNKSGWLTLPPSPGAIANSMQGVACDSSGHLWSFQQFSGLGLGLVRSDGNYTIPLEGTPPPTFQTMRGELLATRNDSILVRRGGELLWFAGPPGLSSPAHEDGAGVVWYLCTGGLVRLDGAFQQQVVPGPVGAGLIAFVLEDEASGLWFRSAQALHRLDGTGWSSVPLPQEPFKTASGLGREVWFAFPDSGLRRFDTSVGQWTLATALPDYVAKDVRFIHMLQTDSHGTLWLGGGGGDLWSLLGTGWEHEIRGLLYPQSLFEDPRGRLFIVGAEPEPGMPTLYVREGGTWSPALPYDFIQNSYPIFREPALRDSRGEPWFFSSFFSSVAFADAEGLRAVQFRHPVGESAPVFLDADDQLWYPSTVMRLDRTPPITMILDPPSLRSSSSQVSLTLAPVIEPATGVQYRARVDEGSWEPWSSNPIRTFEIGNGDHCIEIQGRDRWGNIEPTPQLTCFEIDTTAPRGSLAGTPALLGRGEDLVVVGTVADSNFVSYSVRLVRLACGSEDSLRTMIAGPISQPVVADTLAVFANLPADWEDGRYLVELVVRDDLGAGTTNQEVTLDRAAPAAEATSPSFRTRASGGDVFAEAGGAILSLPPNALANDATVRVELAQAASFATPPAGSRVLGDVVVLAWDPPVLDKRAVLSIRTGSTCRDPGTDVLPAGPVPVAYHLGDDGNWEHRGGTVRHGTAWVDVLVDGPGTYALFEEGAGPPPAQASLGTELVLTPRVLHRSGASAAPAVLLSFTMEAPGPVTGFVHNRAGRLVRTLAEASPLGAGIQSLRWDGRDDRGDVALGGLYIVTVRTPVRTLTKSCLIQEH